MYINNHKLFLIQTSACIAETSTYPLDYIKTKIQINHYKTSVFDIIQNDIIHKDKFKIYNGLKPALLRHCIYTTLRVNIYESFRDKMKNKDNQLNISQKYLIGGLSGGISQIITSPCDLLKIRYITNINSQNKNITLKTQLKKFIMITE